MRVRGLRRLIWYCALAVSLAACAGSLPRNPVPLGMESDAAVVGMGGETIRFWGDRAASQRRRHGQGEMGASPRLPSQACRGKAAGRSSASWLFPAAVRTAPSAPAFSPAGPQRGNRPEFDLVTGVSTGALTAPFAFLGPRYDACAEEGLHRVRPPATLPSRAPSEDCLAASALASNAPLARVIAFYVNDGFLKEVAAEHMKGRRLLIGTTNLDAQRPVIWDMGKIASSGHPGAHRIVPQGAARVGGDPCRVPAGFRRGRSGWRASTRRCMSTAARPAKSSCCRPRSWPRTSTPSS